MRCLLGTHLVCGNTDFKQIARTNALWNRHEHLTMALGTDGHVHPRGQMHGRRTSRRVVCGTTPAMIPSLKSASSPFYCTFGQNE